MGKKFSDNQKISIASPSRFRLRRGFFSHFSSGCYLTKPECKRLVFAQPLERSSERFAKSDTRRPPERQKPAFCFQKSPTSEKRNALKSILAGF